MKRRVVSTYKILAVVLAAAPGCAREPPPELTSQIPGPPLETKSAPAPPPQAVATAAARMGPPDPALVALARDLDGEPRDQVLKSPARFRPLCDAEGYPLVGNLHRKSGGYSAGAFCADVRSGAAGSPTGIAQR